ncbi:hypothetical protein CF327_g7153, partial [Tilletia walkeri]
MSRTGSAKAGSVECHVSKAEPEFQLEIINPNAKANKESITNVQPLNISSAGTSKTGLPASKKAGDKDDGRRRASGLTPTLNSWITILPNFPLTQSALPASYNPAKSLDPAPFEIALKFLASHKGLITQRVAKDDGDDQDPTDACLFEAFQAQ